MFVETFLHRLSNESGLTGLACMESMYLMLPGPGVRVVRPMLDITKVNPHPLSQHVLYVLCVWSDFVPAYTLNPHTACFELAALSCGAMCVAVCVSCGAMCVAVCVSCGVMCVAVCVSCGVMCVAGCPCPVLL